MRRLVGLLVAVAMVSGLVAVMAAGCGKTTTKGLGIITPRGKVTITKSGNRVTVTRASRKTTWTATTASEKALGVPVPADATLVKGTAVKVEGPGDEKWLGATFFTEDEVDAVINYYKSKLSGMPGFSDTSTNISDSMAGLFSVRTEESVKSVIVRKSASGERGKTTIQIATAEDLELEESD